MRDGDEKKEKGKRMGDEIKAEGRRQKEEKWGMGDGKGRMKRGSPSSAPRPPLSTLRSPSSVFLPSSSVFDLSG
jgi:hypothetical protein